METRANYVVTGAFTLAVIAGVFSFIFWFHNSGSGGERASYRVVFTGSVSGLRSGGSTAFASARFPGLRSTHTIRARSWRRFPSTAPRRCAPTQG